MRTRQREHVVGSAAGDLSRRYDKRGRANACEMREGTQTDTHGSGEYWPEYTRKEDTVVYYGDSTPRSGPTTRFLRSSGIWDTPP